MSARARVEERVVVVNDLPHHVIEWRPEGLAAPEETFVLCHGFLDLAWSFRDVADALAAAGHRVVAFDWRGHGETGWVGDGGYYHFPDYVRDLDRLLPLLDADGAGVHLVGHSMGGTVVSLYVGARGGAHVRTLALLEGLGPPPHDAQGAPVRMRSFLDGTLREAARRHRPMVDLDEALTRMRVQSPELPEALGRFLAEKGTRPGPGGEGRVWRFDPLHRTSNPNPIPVDAWVACARRIAVPTLLVRGSVGLAWPDESARLDALPGAVRETLEGVGHMMHRQAPEALARLLLAHAARGPRAG